MFVFGHHEAGPQSLNERPSEKEGKYRTPAPTTSNQAPLNESPSEKEGKSHRGSDRLDSQSRFPQ